jgi:hypothetical protein
MTATPRPPEPPQPRTEVGRALLAFLEGQPTPADIAWRDIRGDICAIERAAALASSPTPAGPTPDDMADIMQAATGGPDFTVKDWPDTPRPTEPVEDESFAESARWRCATCRHNFTYHLDGGGNPSNCRQVGWPKSGSRGRQSCQCVGFVATRPAEPAMTPRDKEAAIIGGPFYSSRDPGRRSRP